MFYTCLIIYVNITCIYYLKSVVLDRCFIVLLMKVC